MAGRITSAMTPDAPPITRSGYLTYRGWELDAAAAPASTKQPPTASSGALGARGRARRLAGARLGGMTAAGGRVGRAGGVAAGSSPPRSGRDPLAALGRVAG